MTSEWLRWAIAGVVIWMELRALLGAARNKQIRFGRWTLERRSAPLGYWTAILAILLAIFGVLSMAFLIK